VGFFPPRYMASPPLFVSTFYLVIWTQVAHHLFQNNTFIGKTICLDYGLTFVGHGVHQFEQGRMLVFFPIPLSAFETNRFDFMFFDLSSVQFLLNMFDGIQDCSLRRPLHNSNLFLWAPIHYMARCVFRYIVLLIYPPERHVSL
jgi:hypothetical protein